MERDSIVEQFAKLANESGGLTNTDNIVLPLLQTPMVTHSMAVEDFPSGSAPKGMQGVHASAGITSSPGVPKSDVVGSSRKTSRASMRNYVRIALLGVLLVLLIVMVFRKNNKPRQETIDEPFEEEEVVDEELVEEEIEHDTNTAEESESIVDPLFQPL